MRNVLRNDLLYALRLQRKTPLLTAAILLSLAIGIGANTAVFSVINALLLKPLPFPHQDRLAAIWLHSPGVGIFRDWPSPGQYLDLLHENHSFSQISISRLERRLLSGSGEPKPVNIIAATSNLMGMLGGKPLVGRTLTREDDKPGGTFTAILTYGAWQRLFGGNRAILGQAVVLDGQAYTVAGVLVPQFRISQEIIPAEEPMNDIDFVLPFGLTAKQMAARYDENYNLIAELKAGVTIPQAQADVDLIASRIRAKDKRDRTYGMTVLSLHDQVVGDVRPIVLVIFGSVCLVLLTACSNVANLLLTRAAARQKEMAIRAALGASGKDLTRQLLVESVLLSVVGAIAGIGLAWVALALVKAINPGNIPRLGDIHIDTTVLLFTLLVSVLTGVAFGLAPASRALKVDLSTSLQSGGRRSEGQTGLSISRQGIRGLLVVAQLAFSLVLLAGAGLLGRSFIQLLQVSPGFQTNNILTMHLARPHSDLPNAAPIHVARFEQLRERILQIPGVQDAGFVSSLPLTANTGWGVVQVEGFTPAPGQELQSDFRLASPGYFETMRIALRAGRFFTQHDNTGSERVGIVDEHFARRFWPKGDAVGKHVWFDPKHPIRVIGIVDNIKEHGLGIEDKVTLYLPHAQNPDREMYLAVRTAGDPVRIATPILNAIRELERDMAIFEVQTMDSLLDRSLARQRFATVMLGAFAFFTLALAAIGIYGVMSYLVTQNTHDIGLRMALGAQSVHVLGSIFRQAMTLALAGTALGLAGAVILTRFMSGLLFKVDPEDPMTFLIAAVILLAIAACAAIGPGARALRISPMRALLQ